MRVEQKGFRALKAANVFSWEDLGFGKKSKKKVQTESKKSLSRFSFWFQLWEANQFARQLWTIPQNQLSILAYNLKESCPVI